MRQMVISCAVLMSLATDFATAAESFAERFALSDDRESVLQELIPGTQEYYYFHCLHFQNMQQYDQVDNFLKKWIARHRDGDLIREIQYRQAVLTYDRSPQKSLDFIRSACGLQFNHQQDTPNAEPNLPESLNEVLISRERLLKQALAEHRDLKGLTDESFRWLIDIPLSPDRRRHLLSRLDRPDFPGLAKLIVDDLEFKNSGGFGSLKIHNRLLLDQLRECARLMPSLLDQSGFVNVWLQRLAPDNDVNTAQDREARDAHLTRLWEFVKPLSPTHNSLKAHVLYQRLDFNRTLNKYDKNLFLEYIRLPRSAPYMNSSFMKQPGSQRFAADLSADFSSVTQSGVIGNDEALIREYLHHFLSKADDTREFDPWLNDKYLTQRLAETKIVNGSGNPEQWYSLLDPADYQKLRDRVDVDFAATNKSHFTANQPVSLDVYIKNVPTLIVRVFTVNTANYYRDFGREVNTDIDLDGLVANQEQTFEYSEPPLRRVRRHFEFPELSQRGTYVIDFIGNGHSSRALIRKGQLRFVVRTTPSGQLFTVFDETGQTIASPRITLGQQDYEADGNGNVLLPFSTDPGERVIIVSSGSFSTLGRFHHQAENYELRAGILIDRQSLLRMRKAKVIIRPQLLLNNRPVSLSRLKNVRLTLTSTNHDEVSTTSIVTDFKLFEDREAEHEFLVPDRLSSMAITLSAQVRNQSQSKDVDLTVGDTYAVNAIDRTEKIENVHLSKVDNRFVIDVLGRTGEVKTHRPVQLTFRHRDFTREVHVSLRSNANGRIDLGSLPQIRSVTARLPSGLEQTWQITPDQIDHHRVVHGIAGSNVRIPCLLSNGRPSRQDVSLCELRGGHYFADRFDAIRVKDGFLELNNLAGGDYSLLLRESGERILIRLTDGHWHGQYLIGNYRVLQQRRLDPLHVRSIDVRDGRLRINIENATKFARVHIFANNFLPAVSHFGKLSGTFNPGVSVQHHLHADSMYAQGRKIGDEYRYILDRRLADKYPGNMNARPEILLNPWAVRSTDTERQDAEAGSEFAPGAAPQAPAESMDSQANNKSEQQGDFANLDFMAQPAIVATNLVIDDDGMVTIDLDDLGTLQHLHVVAVDPVHTVSRSYSLADRSPQALDQRLATTLPVDGHFSQQKQIDIVPAGEEFRISDVTTSRFQIYDDLAGVYQLYQSLLTDPKLDEFQFILTWPDLDQEEKQKLYSEFACHELNFFISRKDPEFFNQVVKPYLANKRDRTFLDQWLLDKDLSPYLTPWRYQRLNAVEKALLGRRIAAERDVTARYLREQLATLPPDATRSELLFGTAINANVMNWDTSVDSIANGVAEPAFGFVAPQGQAGRFGLRRELRLMERFKSPVDGNKDEALKKLSQARGGEEETRARRRLSEEKENVYFADDFESQKLARLFRQTEKTQEWAENNYYKLPIASQSAEHVTVNAFWSDFAAHADEQSFFSSHLPEASRNFSEVMFALSLLDLPFRAGEHIQEQNDVTWSIRAASPLAIVHEQIKPTSGVAEDLPILASQNFFRHGDRYRTVNGQRQDKFISGEFLVHTVYGCQVVLTNPTSSNQKLNLLLQIPEGSVPVLSSHYTHSHEVALEPYKTSAFEYYFYFPMPGEFAHHPVNVARDEQLVTNAAAARFTVVERPTTQDTESWDYVSQYASTDDVLKYLQTHNLHQTNLSRIAWRMHDREFFARAINLLTRHHAFDATLWSYGVQHDDKQSVREFLGHHQQFATTCGPVLSSPLLDIEPVERHLYEHLEYRPLVNARAHQLGDERKILNDRFRAQFASFTKLLSYKRSLSDRDLMTVTGYLLVQDRIAEALAFFSRINAQNLDARMQYDYMAAYCDFFDGELNVARAIVKKYAEHPVDRWRQMFAAMAQQIREFDSADRDSGTPDTIDPDDRNQLIAQLAASECTFDVAVDQKGVELDYQNLETIHVNYYLMDIELLFSRNPFVQQQSGNFAHIHPNLTQTYELPSNRRQFQFELPEQLRNRNVLVEVVGRGKTKRAAWYSNSLTLQVSDNYGQLRASDEKGRRPLPGVYVKTYARMKDGSTRFHKDGYTDLRGRFDYASLSTSDLDQVERFALLVMSDDHGAVVREVAPPTR